MRKKLLSVLLLLLILSCSACSESLVMPEPHTGHISVKPDVGENYYGNINYDYLSQSQIPYGKTRYGFSDNIFDEMEKNVSFLIDCCVRNEAESGSFEEAVKEIYLQYIDADARNKAGAGALLQYAGMIESCGSIDELVNVMGFLYQNCGVTSFFRPDVTANFKDTSVNFLYLMNMNTLGNMKENFTKTDAGPEEIGKFVEGTLKALAVEPHEAKQRAKNVVKLLNEIMLATMDADDMFDMSKNIDIYTKDELQTLFSNIDTDKMLRSFGFDVEQCIVRDEGQAKKINELLTTENMRELKDYLLACVLYEYSRVLPPAYSENFSSFSDFEKNPDEDAKRFLCDLLEMEIGVIYGREICSDNKVTDMVAKMVSQIQESCRELIRNCDRLSDDAEEKYLRKIDNMLVKLGYDKNMTLPYTITPVKNGGNLIENAIAIKRGRIQKLIGSVGKAPDRNQWQMSAIEVNATYYPLSNTFEIPAVMMSEAVADPDDNEYYNLGKIGYVIGHEMSHAFDSNGFKYDEYGNLNPEWLAEEDQERYRQLMDKTTAYYNNFKLLDMYNIKGDVTLSENLADLSSVQCLLNVTDDRENQRHILEGIAVQWASLTAVKDMIIQLNGDVHSPSEARVNAVVSSMDAFYEVYDIKENDKMYVSPENRVKVW